MLHHEEDGKVYCDWRLTIHGCEGEKFLYVAFIYATVASFIATASILGALFTRKFLNGESWKSFLKGEPLSLVTVLLIFVFHCVQMLIILLEGPYPATGILWTFLDGTKFLSQGLFIGTVTQALPKSLLVSENSRWYLDTLVQSRLLTSIASFFALVHVVLLSVAFGISEDQPEVSRRLEKAGLILADAFYILLAVAQIGSAYTLRSKIRAVLSETKRFEKGEIDNTLLGLTDKKLGQMIFTVFVNGLFGVVFFTLLAFYPDFFTNLNFSKAMLVIFYDINFTNGMLFGVTNFFLEMKKYVYHETIKESSSKGSKRDDSTTGNQQVATVSGKDTVEMIISELNPQAKATSD